MKRPSRSRGGFTLVELLVVLAIMGILIGLFLAAVQRVREAANRQHCQDHLRQMGLALHGYHDSHRSFPPGTSVQPDPYVYLGWQARILPWIEQGALWAGAERDYRTNPRFWVPPRHRALSVVIPLYICPSDGRATGIPQPENYPVAFTHYQGVSGDRGIDGLLFLNSKVCLANVTDGTSQTLLVGERPPSSNDRFGWWYAGSGQLRDGCADAYLSVRQANYSIREPTCPFGPYHFKPGASRDPCDTFHFWSRHPGGANFLFADGSVRFLTYAAEPLMVPLATRSGGESVPPP